jgi:hypothetical protein
MEKPGCGTNSAGLSSACDLFVSRAGIVGLRIGAGVATVCSRGNNRQRQPAAKSGWLSESRRQSASHEDLRPEMLQIDFTTWLWN